MFMTSVGGCIEYATVGQDVLDRDLGMGLQQVTSDEVVAVTFRWVLLAAQDARWLLAG